MEARWWRDSPETSDSLQRSSKKGGDFEGGFEWEGDSHPSLWELWGSPLWVVLSPEESGMSLSLTEDICQRWAVSVTYYNLLKQSILMPYHSASPVLVLRWSSLELLLNYFLLFVCRHYGSWERLLSWRDIQPNWSLRWPWWAQLPVGC